MTTDKKKSTRKRPRLICLVGIDGSGKTTQAQKLVECMRTAGIETSYIWNIFEPLLLKPFMKIGRALFLHNKNPFQNYPDYYEARKKLFQQSGTSAFFHYFFFSEYLFRFIIKLRVPLLLGRSVVCDRYVFDAVISHAANLDYPVAKIKSTIKHLLYFLPKPDFIFLIDLPEEIAFNRKDDVVSLDYLKKRRQIYLSIAKEYGMNILDGTKEVSYLQETIWSQIGGGG